MMRVTEGGAAPAAELRLPRDVLGQMKPGAGLDLATGFGKGDGR
jgi:hypothetical protein